MTPSRRARLASSTYALRVSEERYAVAVAGCNEGLWDWDIVNGEVFLSPRARQVCGLAPAEPLQPCRCLMRALRVLRYHPQDRLRVRAALVDHLRGRSPCVDVEIRMTRSGGEARPDVPDDWTWVRQRGMLARDAQGRPRRMAGFVEDITDRKRGDTQREQREVRLRTARQLEAMGILAGDIAHDFNNILGAILGYAELAHAQAVPGGSQQQQLEGVIGAGLRAKSLVQSILAFSHSRLVVKVAVHVQKVVQQALDLLQTSLPAGIVLERELEAGTASLVGDPAQILQVVMNLGTNAVQASSPPGVVRVRLCPRILTVTTRLTSGDLPPGCYLELVVHDHGRGMTPDQVERAFDPFFTTRDVGAASGLGLSLVHGVVTELGGAIDVRSAPAEGSTFTVLLPCAGEIAPGAGAAPEDRPLPRGRGERILVVDDEAQLVALGEETLAMLGYEPVGYTSSTEALEAFQGAPSQFDALLTDEAMPQLTGSDLAVAARRLRPDLPVILMTGFVSPAVAGAARAGSVQEVLTKPLVARDIAQALARALRHSTDARAPDS